MLTLSNQYVGFEAGPKSDVFFDNVNKKICTVRSNGAMGITTKGLRNEDVISFRTRDSGKINSLNFSTDGLIAGIHRQKSDTVNFVFLDPNVKNDDRVLQDYSQKSKSDGILGIEWINEKQVVYITDRGLELYQFNIGKKTVKLIRSECFELVWYVYYPSSQLLICSSGVTCGILNLFIVQNGVIHKLPKFEADFGCSSLKIKLANKDVSVASIYGKLYILVLKYNKIEPGVERINLYLLKNDAAEPPKLAHSLLVNAKGPIGVHVVDNVIVAHQMMTTKSLLFDIHLAKPAIEIHPFASTTILISEALKSVYDTDDIALYKQSWALFAPNLIADARFGIFTQLELLIQNAPEFIEDKMLLLEFISNRSNSKEMFLQTLKGLLAVKALTIKQTAEIFAWIVNLPGTAHIITKESTHKFRLIVESFQPLRIDYNSIVQNVLFILKEESMDMHFLAAITLEFLLVLRQTDAALDVDLLSELLLHTLIEAGEFSKLKQLLQYRVLDDSKLLPLDLISLSHKQHEFDQIAVDILRRQGKFKRIAEHRIEQKRPVAALKSLRDQKIDFPLCLRLLESAWATNSRQTKFTVYTTLKEIRKLPFFDAPDEQLDKYNREFKLLFNEEEIEEAERRFRLAAISGSSASISAMNSSRRDSIDLDESIDQDDSEDIDNEKAPGAGASQ